MYLMIDNYDSFVYNLKAYFEELGKEIAVRDYSLARAKTPAGRDALHRYCRKIPRENTDTWRLLRSPGARTLLWCNGGKRDISDPWENL